LNSARSDDSTAGGKGDRSVDGGYIARVQSVSCSMVVSTEGGAVDTYEVDFELVWRRVLIWRWEGWPVQPAQPLQG
jgi:hypothetical protein